MKARFFWLLAPVMAFPLVGALAQDAPASATAARDHVTVRAKARVTAPADELELVLFVQGSSEAAADAEKKHRDKLKRLLAALGNKENPAGAKDDSDGGEKDKSSDKDGDDDKPKKKKTKKHRADEADDALPQAGVPDEDGLVFDFKEGRYTLGVKADPNQLDDGTGNGEGMQKEGELGCASTVVVTLKNLRKSNARKIRRILACVLDRASDAGIDFAPVKSRLRPTLRFRVADPEALRKQAYSDAIAKARARAADLAKLVGRDVGKVISVNDLPEAGAGVAALDDTRTEDFELYLTALQAVDPAAHDAASGSSEVTVEASVELEVELK